MLLEISIHDLALIERATLTFGSGLNVITGETGAGKSLLIDALELLLGQRARAGLVRAGAQKAVVEGRFAIEPGGYGELVATWLRTNLPEALDEEGDGAELELILTRTLGRDGRTRAHVNHRPVTQRILKELTAHLVEIHGQNDHQRLFDATEQLRLLDSFGALRDALGGYVERRERWSSLAARLEGFDQEEGERLQRLDWLRFQAAELREAALDKAEFEELSGERELLRNAGVLVGEVGGALFELAESDGAMLDRLRAIEQLVGEWAERVDVLRDPAGELRTASAALESAVSELRTFVDGVEADPERLQFVEDRLHAYEELTRKYRLSVEELAGRLEEIEGELQESEDQASGREQLGREVADALAALRESAKRLSTARKKLRTKLKRAVEKGLKELGLEGARFDVQVQPRAEADEHSVEQLRRTYGAHGLDDVEFLLAANPGEPTQPLRKVASGGEMARIMLALRGALAVHQSTPTLIFDEVDTGVGGRLGPKVGQHLEQLAAHHQILCVTHLPAIAALAHHHLRVKKEVEEGRTRTHVDELVGAARVDEVADMIAGGADFETARAEARRLLSEGA